MVDGSGPKQLAPFSQAAFERWALATHDKSPDSVKYYMSRLRAMLRLGLDVDAFLASPAGARDQAEQLVARVKARPRYSAHVGRNYARVLNWLCAYAEHLAGAEENTWKRRPLPKEPPAVPKTVEAPDLSVLWTYQGPDPYTTLLRRAIAEVALAGNFRRRELGELRLRHLKPETGQIELVRAGKGSISGLVEVPWTLYWPESALLQYLAVRHVAKGSDALWTTHFGGGRPLSPASVYGHLKAMGEELGIPLSFIRTKRRALTDADRQIRDLRITQAKSRHVKVDNLMTYLGRIDGPTVRSAQADANVPGYDEVARQRAVSRLPSAREAEHQPRDEGQDADGDDGVARRAPVAGGLDGRRMSGGLDDSNRLDGEAPGGRVAGGDRRQRTQGARDLELRRAHAPKRPEHEQERHGGDDAVDGKLHQQPVAVRNHARPTPPNLFPLSPPTPLRDAKKASSGASKAGVVAPAHAARLSTPPGLSPLSGSALKSAADPTSPVEAGKSRTLLPNGCVRMELQNLVSKAGRLDRPIALVAVGLNPPELTLVPHLVEDNTGGRDGRPRTGVEAPAQELPRHEIPHKAGVEWTADLGAFTHIGVVAPSGSSQTRVPSRYPATRPAQRHEIYLAARRGGA